MTPKEQDEASRITALVPSAIDSRKRGRALAALESDEFDLLVIGAGITGAGIARDAAMRGLRVALVDASDFAAGTSSRSSKLVHGGMRYLVQGHVHIVREAANERQALRRIAPHLAQPLPVVIPRDARSALMGIKVAVMAYERLGHVAKNERHQVWDRERLAEEEPHYNTSATAGAVVYPEYATDDARLTLANVRSAVAAGAIAVNYAAATEIVIENGKASGAIVRDALTDNGPSARIRARTVVNAAGPWIDAIRQLEEQGAPERLQLTKGIHLVLKRERVPINNMVTMSATDGRDVFVIPRGPYVYIGTTDTFYPHAAYWPEVTAEDADYLLAATSGVFDVRALTRDDVISVWSGIRPLLKQEGKRPSEISRRNEIMHGPAGVLSIAGGKLTSYRIMAEHVTDACETHLGRKPTPTRTNQEPLPGGNGGATLDQLTSALERRGFNHIQAERAVRLYGSEANAVFATGTGPAAEAAFAVTHEGATTLEDYWVRRSERARFDDRGGLDTLDEAAIQMASLLGWSETKRKEQIAACISRRDEEMHAMTTSGDLRLNVATSEAKED